MVLYAAIYINYKFHIDHYNVLVNTKNRYSCKYILIYIYS